MHESHSCIMKCKGCGIGEQGGYASSLFQFCELGGLASRCVNLGTLECNSTHIYLDIKADIIILMLTSGRDHKELLQIFVRSCELLSNVRWLHFISGL